ncbi:DUF1348 family protein [Candidatus Obscuribacterales bacterium]|nr:DUF1348 family protein [Candidatus Obscuribacterales bacterium]MBX3153321.1 DUF1348 family protein [Candidatus Obscuribacterales bacterium]
MRFSYEGQGDSGNCFRAYGKENWSSTVRLHDSSSRVY